MSSAIEVLKELQKEYVKCIDGVHIISPEYDALGEALLALEQIGDIKLDLKLIIQNINEDNYVNLKQGVLDDLKEVLGGNSK